MSGPNTSNTLGMPVEVVFRNGRCEGVRVLFLGEDGALQHRFVQAGDLGLSQMDAMVLRQIGGRVEAIKDKLIGAAP